MEQDVNEMENKNPEGIPYTENVGSALRGLLNSVKQTAKSFAKIHNLDPDYLEKVMDGKEPLTQEVVDAVNNHSPLNVCKLYSPEYRNKFPIRDDTKDGVVIFSAQQRSATERIMERGPEGQKVPFYNYADTAMSTTSPFRPEWIKELYVHDGNEANLPDWAFNQGHFEYQITYFIGPVNFYWIDKEGKKHVRQMNTGDINYVTPFVPHTFTTREEGNGLIMAVTYGGAVATDEFQTKIKAMDLDEYKATIKDKLPAVEQGLITDELEGVLVRRNQDAALEEKNPYDCKELMSGIPNQPNTKSFEYILKKGNDEKELDIEVDAERWGYNVGETPIMLIWGNNEQKLDPGSSFFIRPNIKHAFRNASDGRGKLVVMEIKPIAGDPMKDLALIYKYSGQEGLERVHSETKQWF